MSAISSLRTMAPSSIMTLRAVIPRQDYMERKSNEGRPLPTTVTEQMTEKTLNVPLQLSWSVIWPELVVTTEITQNDNPLLKQVRLYCLEFSLHAKDAQGERKEFKFVRYDRSTNNVIILSNETQYKCVLGCCREVYHECTGSDISVELNVVLLECKFDTITDVSIPPCSHNLGTLLAFATEGRFTDVKILATPSSVNCCVPVRRSKRARGSAEPQLAEDSAHFFAHKAILAASSPVFEKMFEHDLQESATNSITVEDIEPEVLKEMLTYIYTNQAPNIKDMATSLLYAAEKYQLEGLKAMCEQFLSYNLQVSNAPQTLLLAQTHNACQLKKNALKFIVKHIDKVRESKDWEMVKCNCELMDELLSIVVAKRRCDYM